jgi:hypothetical protein
MGSALVCVVLGVGPKFEPNKFGGVGKKKPGAGPSCASFWPQQRAHRLALGSDVSRVRFILYFESFHPFKLSSEVRTYSAPYLHPTSHVSLFLLSILTRSGSRRRRRAGCRSQCGATSPEAGRARRLPPASPRARRAGPLRRSAGSARRCARAARTGRRGCADAAGGRPGRGRAREWPTAGRGGAAWSRAPVG